MIGKMTAFVAVGLLVGTAAWAEDPRIEISGLAGWTLSDGVSGDPTLAADGRVYNRIDPKDSFSWGLTAGYFFTENWELEFQYDQQPSKLVFGGALEKEGGDFKISTYHGAFVYNFGDPKASVRPYLFLGAGATSYPGITFTGLNGQSKTTDGNSQFSGTFGAGIKLYPGRTAGLKLQARWTPTYIKSDSEGWWCDPYWGCYVVGNAQYSNQFELTGGLTLRF
jgi:outer membrane protein W